MPILPYTSVSISGYNSSPPSDDGSQTDSNRVAWSKHKTKLADPVKTLAETINTNILSAIGDLALPAWTAVTTTATVAESDWHTGLLQLGATPVNYPDPSTFEDGWHHWVFNGATDDITLQATATSFFIDFNGQAASGVSLVPGRGVMVFDTATVYLVIGLTSTATEILLPDNTNFIIANQMFGG